jgi:nucleotide-binding universal stress UspA family protein
MNILFATDGSKHATDAARFLNRLRSREPIDLTVLTVTYRPENMESASVQTWYPDWQKAEQARIDTHYRELNELLHGVKGSVHMMRLEGSPVHTILDTAKQVKCQLIVLGARGHTSLERMLLGSVSDAVATHAPCSVLVVRPSPAAGDAETSSSDQRGKKIALAVDGSPASRAAAGELMRWCWNAEDQFHILSIATFPDYLGQGYAFGPPTDSELERLRHDNKQIVEEVLGDLQNTEQVVSKGSHVGESIVEFVHKHGHDLVVLGESGHSRFETLLLGSTSKYVLRHAPCSVLISRPAADASPEQEKAE